MTTVSHDLRDVRFEGVESLRRPSRALALRASSRAELMARRAERSAHDETALDPLLRFVLERAGLDPLAYRPRALQRRAVACLRLLGVTSPESARTLIARDGPALGAALNAILIGVSDFFRDRDVFAHLERAVLPELLRHRSGLRVVSVGCSGGHEVYSVAMLLTEAGALNASDLIGIDCRADALREAALGCYPSVPGVSATRREAFFEEAPGGWRVHPALRDRATWRQQDLFRFTLEEPAHLLLFRNVAIYLDPQRAAAAWGRLAARAAHGGYLMTGKAERPPAELGLVRVSPCLYRKP